MCILHLHFINYNYYFCKSVMLLINLKNKKMDVKFLKDIKGSKIIEIGLGVLLGYTVYHLIDYILLPKVAPQYSSVGIHAGVQHNVDVEQIGV